MNPESEYQLYDKLQELKDRSGMSLRQIAREMGYAQASSIQRYFSADYPETALPSKIVAKLAAVLSGKGDPKITREEIHSLADVSVADIRRSVPVISKTGIPIVGEVAAGMWMEAALFEAESTEYSTVAFDIRYPAEAQFIVKVRGESLNRIAANGDLLLCVDYLAANITPQLNDLVLVERSRDEGGTIERTAKRLVRHNGQSELMPESSDPLFQESVVFREGEIETTEVKIKAKIVMAFKSF